MLKCLIGGIKYSVNVRIDFKTVVLNRCHVGGSVMVWGGISWRHKTQLIVVDGNLTAHRYINEILEPEVVPFLRNNGNVTLFQQDNAHAHSTRLTMDFFNQNGVQVLPWPAFSLDLNPIEHLWDQFGKSVYSLRHPPINQQQLAMALQEERDNITQEQIQHLIQSMRHQCQATLDAYGGHTRY